VRALDAIGHALGLAGTMTWEVTWSLILGFTLSAVVQAVVRRETVVRLLGDDKPKTLVVASGLGAASSSCSYAAVALARALFRRGASFTAAMAFEIASTNLVIELGIILALLISWQFTLAEFAGGPIMIILVAVGFRLFVRQRLIDAARQQADKGLAGSMEGHAAMDMSIKSSGGFWQRLASREGYTAVSSIFVMEWTAVLRDIIGGLLIAGAVAAWVPDSFWRHLFLTGDPLAARLWGPVIGPVISLLSFMCSIGNVPLAAVLWNGGISFGGVVAFIFADLIIIPILNIYRKYYGTRMMLVLLAIFYASMVAAGYVIEFTFGGLGLIPGQRAARVGVSGVQWNYTTVLNIVFLLVAAALLVRFFRSGGAAMLKMMGGAPDDQASHEHHGQHRSVAPRPLSRARQAGQGRAGRSERPFDRSHPGGPAGHGAAALCASAVTARAGHGLAGMISAWLSLALSRCSSPPGWPRSAAVTWSGGGSVTGPRSSSASLARSLWWSTASSRRCSAAMISAGSTRRTVACSSSPPCYGAGALTVSSLTGTTGQVRRW
jgi:uncharacterized membrane protein YraQ (UPF0718 family)